MELSLFFNLVQWTTA